MDIEATLYSPGQHDYETFNYQCEVYVTLILNFVYEFELHKFDTDSQRNDYL